MGGGYLLVRPSFPMMTITSCYICIPNDAFLDSTARTNGECASCFRVGFQQPHSTFVALVDNGGIRLFASDVIMIGSVRADWPAPFSVTNGNPRADKLGRNCVECIGRRCLVDRERCVRATFMRSAIENYSMLHLQRWLECRGIKRFGTKSRFMIISHNCQSCMCRQ